MFLWRNKKDISIFLMKNVPYLLLFISSHDNSKRTYIQVMTIETNMISIGYDITNAIYASHDIENTTQIL